MKNKFIDIMFEKAKRVNLKTLCYIESELYKFPKARRVFKGSVNDCDNRQTIVFNMNPDSKWMPRVDLNFLCYCDSVYKYRQGWQSIVLIIPSNVGSFLICDPCTTTASRTCVLTSDIWVRNVFEADFMERLKNPDAADAYIDSILKDKLCF